MGNQKSIDWKRERLKLPISDINEHLISVSDIKQYVYCPRVTYFEKVLRIRPVLDSQQKDSKDGHEEYLRKEIKRRDGTYYSPDFVKVTKIPSVHLYSKKLGMHGTVDLIIITENGEYVPVDYKNVESNHGRIWIHHKYQLTAYGLLIEDYFNTLVKRGFINYIPEGTVKKLEITYGLKRYTNHIIKAVKRVLLEEKLPPKKSINCMGGCGYEGLCKNSF